MTLPIRNVVAKEYKNLRRQLFRLLCKRVFHSTTENGYRGIIQTGTLLSSKEDQIDRIWSYDSYFKSIGYVSFCDFFHPKKWSDIRNGIMKYKFYRHKEEKITYLLMLKEDYYPDLLTWKDLVIEDWRGKQIVPHIESGAKSPVPISYFDEIIRIILW